jgi:DNA-binding NarL/FixJ family response regulator
VSVTPIRILVADDHAAIRAGVRAILRGEADLVVVGEATTGEEARRLCADLEPDILLLDLSMPGSSAADTMRFIQTRCLTTRVVVFSVHEQGSVIQRLLSLGASAYVLKDDEPRAIGTAIRSVMQGGTWLSPLAREALRKDRVGGDSDLTERDWQLLNMLAKGKDDAVIAGQLGLALQTVRNYLHDLYKKLGVASRTEAVAWLHRHHPEAR